MFFFLLVRMFWHNPHVDVTKLRFTSFAKVCDVSICFLFDTLFAGLLNEHFWVGSLGHFSRGGVILWWNRQIVSEDRYLMGAGEKK